MRNRRLIPGLLVVLAFVVLLSALAVTTPAAQQPALRPTFPFPAGTSVPITSAGGEPIDAEPGPLYVILSTVDDHGLPGGFSLRVYDRPGLDEASAVGSVPTGAFAQVLEIRRLPPDYLRAFYRVRVEHGVPELIEGWVGDYYARRTAFVVAFDDQGCACEFPVQLWADARRTQPAGALMNRSPLRLLAVTESAVQVQALKDGAIGWLDSRLVHESESKEFIRLLQP